MRSLLALLLALGILFLPGESSAVFEVQFAADVELASVGDLVDVHFELQNAAVVGAGDGSFVYRIPRTARYVAGSLVVDGSAVPDDDPAVSLDGTALLLRLEPIPDSIQIDLRVKVTGEIGDWLQHRVELIADGLFGEMFGAVPTRIGSELAEQVVADVLRDTHIEELRPSFNFGLSPSLRVGQDGIIEQRALLLYDVDNVRGYVSGRDIVGAWVELWPRSGTADGVELFAHRLRQPWVEGVRDGESCVEGATWSSSNCGASWTAGGDLDSAVEGAVTVGMDACVVPLEITPLFVEWYEGSRDNDGIVLLGSGGLNGPFLEFASQDGATSSSPASRLSVVHVPPGVVAQKGVKGIKAEVVPSEVPGGLSNQRFVYGFKPEFDDNSTGINRLTIALPEGFDLVSLDSVITDAGVLIPNLDPLLEPGEYEHWARPDTVDLRLGRLLDQSVADPRVFVVLHLSTPVVGGDTNYDLLSTVDHDRRSYPPQNSGNGDVNEIGGDGDDMTVKVKPKTLAFLTVTPADSTVGRGQSVPYRAWAVFSDLSEGEVTGSVLWSVLPPERGVFDGPPGVLLTLTEGSASVGAELDGHAGEALLDVGPPVVERVWIEPDGASVSVGTSRGFEARAALSSGDTLQVTVDASWDLADTTVAALRGPGLVEAKTVGSTALTATYEAIDSPPVLVDVTPAILQSLSVTPLDTTVAIGLGGRMQAWGRYSDGTLLELGEVVLWSSDPPDILDIGADGVFTTLGEGLCDVTASLAGVTSPPAQVTVGPPVLLSLDGEPDLSNVVVGAARQFLSMGLWSDGSSTDETIAANWTSLEPAIARIIGQGKVQAMAPGLARIRHELNGVEGDTLEVRVITTAIDSLVVAPTALTLPLDVSVPLSATAYFNDGEVLDVTEQTDWLSDSPAVASVDSTGRVRTLSEGAAAITASLGAVSSAPATVVVDALALDGLSITPADTTVALGQVAPFRAWGDVGGTIHDFTADVDWSSDDLTVATIDTLGRATAVGVGSTIVSAALGPVVATPASLEVLSPALLSVEVIPATASVLLGRTKAFRAEAHYSDGRSVDVTSLAEWSSQSPAVAYVGADGVAVSLGLGETLIVARYEGWDSDPARLTVSPSVQAGRVLQADDESVPGANDRLLLSFWLRNAYLTPRRLDAVRFGLDHRSRLDVASIEKSAEEALTGLVLRLDDGDGLFDPAKDPTIASGSATLNEWTPSGLGLDLPVGTTRTLYLSADLSLTAVAQDDSVDAWIESEAGLFWDAPLAVVAQPDFPIDTPGRLRVDGLVLAQLGFSETPADTVPPGTEGQELLRFHMPDDGGRPDGLDHLHVQQLGDAAPVSDLASLRLEASDGAGGWVESAALAHTGGGEWTASTLDLSLPVGGRTLRVVGDLDPRATVGRSLRLGLESRALTTASGRSGPLDGSWSNTASLRIDAVPTVEIGPYPFVAPMTVTRGEPDVPALGVEFVARAASEDSLRAIGFELVDPAIEATGPGAWTHVAEARLWWDVDGDGGLGGTDVLLESVAPDPDGRLLFGETSSLGRALEVGSPVRLLLTLRPDPLLSSDGDELGARLAAAEDVSVTPPMVVELPAPVATPLPARVDGQEVAGYDLRSQQSRIYTGLGELPVVLDVRIPADGRKDDVLRGLRVQNEGTATAAEVPALRLLRDDGDGLPGPEDEQVGHLVAVSAREWAQEDLDIALPAADPRRFYLVLDPAVGEEISGTFLAVVAEGDIEVLSANDGPNDQPLHGGGPLVLAAANQVTWVAGAAGSAAVPPDAEARAILVLDSFNSYLQPRHLRSLLVDLRGTASPGEFGTWSLVPDLDQSGTVDPGEEPLAVALPGGGQVLFAGFDYELIPLQQQRLIVVYSLDPSSARDGSTVDAVVSGSAGLGYDEMTEGATNSAGQFPLDSSGLDIVDGFVLSQLTQRPVPSRALGRGETHALVLDLRLPSNGLGGDTLQELEVEIAEPEEGASAVLGVDVDALRLWAERDTDPASAVFDPGEDLLLATLRDGAGGTRFVGLAADIPPGGRRFYLSCDLTDAPTDGRSLQLRLPVNGAEMLSGNDGPLDGSLSGTAEHVISTSDLLVSMQLDAERVSRGQDVELRVLARNRGDTTLDPVSVTLLEIEPAGTAALLSGPEPASLVLLPDEEAAFVYRFRMDQEGAVFFRAAVGDGQLESDPAESLPVVVQHAPTALGVAGLSTLPASVNRGQGGITPLVWTLGHPDADSLAAAITVDQLELRVETAQGVDQPAADLLDRLEIRRGSIVHTYMDAFGDSSRLMLLLDPPLVLQREEELSLPLSVSIRSDAPAQDFRLQLPSTGAVRARDLNSGAAVDLVGTLPWSTNPAYLLSPSDEVEFELDPALPSRVNRGQREVPAGALLLRLPGSPGEREARVTGLAFEIRDAEGRRRAADELLERVEVRSGAAVLLSTSALDTVEGRVPLSLDIPRVISSSVEERLELWLEMREEVSLDLFHLVFPDSDVVSLRDANSGQPVAVRLAIPQEFPLVEGPVAVDAPASDPQIDIHSLTPPRVAAGESAVPMMRLELSHPGTPGEAAVVLSSLRVSLRDDQGSPLNAATTLAAVRMTEADSVLAEFPSPVGDGEMPLVLPDGLVLGPGETRVLQLEADLAPVLVEPWLWFGLQAGALALEDDNDPLHSLSVAGNLPFNAELLKIVVAPSTVAVGAVEDPTANLARGADDVALIPLELAHPGGENESALRLRSLELRLRTVNGAVLLAEQLLRGARLAPIEGAPLEAVLENDRLRFTLDPLPELAPQETLGVWLRVDLQSSIPVEDFALWLEASDVVAVAGVDTLEVEPLEGAQLPYRSPSIHLLDADLEASLSSYPNPFAAGRESARIAFHLTQPARVSVEIYTITGDRVIRLLEGEPLGAGLHDELSWDGRNGNGHAVRNGVYLLRLQVDGPDGGEFLRKLAVRR